VAYFWRHKGVFRNITAVKRKNKGQRQYPDMVYILKSACVSILIRRKSRDNATNIDDEVYTYNVLHPATRV